VDLPAVAAGAYTLWESDRLLYVGAAGDNWTASEAARHRRAGAPRGLYPRLQAHASGKRRGNAFCIALWDRLLRLETTQNDRQTLGIDFPSPEAAIRVFLSDRCFYRFQVLDDAPLIRRVVIMIRRGCLSAGKPLLNPLADTN
jgi:hypothetical protein